MNYNIIDVTPGNVREEGIFCAIKNQYMTGIEKKIDWFNKRYNEGLRMKIVKNESGEAAGFIEYVPGEFAWRTVDAKGYMFIHCLQVSRNKTGFGYGRILLQECIEDSKGTNGIVIVTSRKPWVNDKAFFLKHGFFAVQMQAWKSHMLSNGITLDEWERFAASIGRESDPVSAQELTALLHEAGFTNTSRFFGSYLIEGYIAFKKRLT